MFRYHIRSILTALSTLRVLSIVRTKYKIELKIICLADISRLILAKKRLKAIEIDFLDSESPNKKVKTSEKINETEHILIIPLDIEDDDSQETTICEMIELTVN
jgi:hypothetical protein